MAGPQEHLLPIQRHRIFRSLTPRETSDPLHEIGKTICNKNPAYTPSMWAAYFEEWINCRRQMTGYLPRGSQSPPLSANLEESILSSAEANMPFCTFTEDVAGYLRGKYGLFPYEQWADMIQARREMQEILSSRHQMVDTSRLRLLDGSRYIQVQRLRRDEDDPWAELAPVTRNAWSRYWPATHGHDVPTVPPKGADAPGWEVAIESDGWA